MNPFNAPINSPLLSCITPLLKDIAPQVYKAKVTLVHRPYLSSGLGPHPVDIELMHVFGKEWFINRIQTFNKESPSNNTLHANLNFDFLHNQFHQPDLGHVELNHPSIQDLYHSWQDSLLKQIHQGLYDHTTLSIVEVWSSFPFSTVQ